MLHGFRRFRAEGKPEDGIRCRGRETVWTPICPVAGTVGREGGQAGKRACFLTGNALVAILGSQFVTILSPRRIVRVEKRAFPDLEKRHNQLVERML
jgi:hypothetical protein